MASTNQESSNTISQQLRFCVPSLSVSLPNHTINQPFSFTFLHASHHPSRINQSEANLKQIEVGKKRH